ncbi:MAG: hypothetical protein V4658_08225 [Bacteroidota bacterium]
MKRSLLRYAVSATLLLPALCTTAQDIGDAYPNARETFNDAVELYNEKKYNDAIEKLALINENDSFYYNAAYQMAVSYDALKQFDKAKQKALEGLSAKTLFERDFMIAYATILDNTGQRDSAIRVLDQGLNKYPYYARFQYEKAFLYAKNKDWDNAIRYYTEALKINSFYSYAHYRIGFIAANAKKPTLALMAFNAFCMVNNDDESVFNVILTMEKIAGNEYEPDTFAIDEKHLAFAKDLEDIDLIIHSKAALSPKYKSLVKLNYNIVKQMQVLCEKLPDGYDSENWLMNFYVQLHKKMWNEKKYVGSALHNLRFIDNKYVQSEVKSKAKDVTAFQEWAGKYLDEYRNKKSITVDGKPVEIHLWWSNNQLNAIGEENDKKENIGPWVYYGEYGFKEAEGNYQKGKKEGPWKYYYDGGELRSIEEYKNGLNNGSFEKHYVNGALQEISTYENDKMNGKVKLYNSNNTLSVEASVDIAGKINGTRFDYDDLGRVKTERAMKNSLNEGVYKTFHPNGKVNMDAAAVADNLTGKVTYYFGDGSIQTTGTFAKGYRHGDWKWLYVNGKTETTGSYANGKETGIWKYYYDDGTLQKEENYENGTKKGSYKFYDREGLLYAEIFVKAGKIDAYKYTDKSGKVFSEAKSSGNKLHYVLYSEYRNKTMEGDLANGDETGTWKYYTENGALEYELTYEKGKREGLMKYYYPNGKLQYQLMYTNNEREGYYRSVFKNGKTETEGYYCEGNRCGAWIYYNANGTISSKTFYVNDEVIGRDYDYMPDGSMFGYGEYELGYFSNYFQTDSAGKVYRNTGLKFSTGLYELKSKEGRLLFAGKYVGGTRDSLHVHYFGNGKITTSEWYDMGKSYGPYTRYYENGKTQSAGNSKDGEQDSTWVYYNEQGEKNRVSNFKHDKYDGKYTTYFPNGKVEIECFYTEGLLNGNYKRYSLEGTLIFDGTYEGNVLRSYTYLGNDGKLLPAKTLTNETGEVLTYYPNGNIAMKYNLVNGLIHGAYVRNFPNGKPIVECNYADDMCEGILKVYHSNGHLKKTENYLYDQLDGKVTEYYDTGKISRETMYIFGYKHGLSKSFDVNGKQTSTTSYRFNKIL